MIKDINKALNLSDKEDISKFYLLILFYFLIIFLEIFSLAMVLPVVNVFFSEASILDNSFLSSYFDQSLIQKFKYEILLFFLILFVIKNFAIILITKKKYNFLFYIQSKIAKKIYRSYIGRPYNFFFKNSTSSLSNIVVAQSQSVKAIIEVLITFIVEGSLIFFILLFLISFNAKITISIIVLFGIIYKFFYPYLKKKTTQMGTERIIFGKKIMKVVNESFGGIKTVKIYKKENFFKKLFYKISDKTWDIENRNIFLLEIPRYIVEVILITIFIVIVIFFSLNNYSNEYIITFCSLYLIALYRLLPSFNKILASIHSFRYYVPTINIISKEIDELKNYEKNNKLNSNKTNYIGKNIIFKTNIKLKDVSFKYETSNDYIFENLNLTITKNKFIGIVGYSGSGKTTLVDIISGLFNTEKGEIFIDEQNVTNNPDSLKDKIGYVPQDIFLLEESIKSNIIFNDLDEQSKEVNNNKLREALENSNLKEYVNNLKYNIDTLIGEEGVQLSGGQRQRIGIARALYRNSEIIIFDEATSSLDKDTENIILNEINKLKKFKTIIYITHKENTLKYADEIYRISEKKLVQIK